VGAAYVRPIGLPFGGSIPALGQGTAGLAEGRHPDDQEIAALRLGLDLGMSLIDSLVPRPHGPRADVGTGL
jgi:diketogulonate reductase-like aldo/keto reductase